MVSIVIPTSFMGLDSLGKTRFFFLHWNLSFQNMSPLSLLQPHFLAYFLLPSPTPAFSIIAKETPNQLSFLSCQTSNHITNFLYSLLFPTPSNISPMFYSLFSVDWAYLLMLFCLYILLVVVSTGLGRKGWHLNLNGLICIKLGSWSCQLWYQHPSSVWTFFGKTRFFFCIEIFHFKICLLFLSYSLSFSLISFCHLQLLPSPSLPRKPLIHCPSYLARHPITSQISSIVSFPYFLKHFPKAILLFSHSLQIWITIPTPNNLPSDGINLTGFV